MNAPPFLIPLALNTKLVPATLHLTKGRVRLSSQKRCGTFVAGDRENINLRLPLASVALGLALTPLAAPLLADCHPLTALFIRNFFSSLCHQNPARSFVIQGSPAAVCVRCLGIYCGAALGILATLERAPAIWLLELAMLLNLLDVTSAMLHWHGDHPWARLLLGLLLGAGAGAVLQPVAGRLPRMSARGLNL